jgi:hypothetical protein
MQLPATQTLSAPHGVVAVTVRPLVLHVCTELPSQLTPGVQTHGVQLAAPLSWTQVEPVEHGDGVVQPLPASLHAATALPAQIPLPGEHRSGTQVPVSDSPSNWQWLVGGQ